MARDKLLTVQRTIYMTPEMWRCIEQLAQSGGHERNENVLMREALRFYIDNQSEVIGSRRHFQKSFQERIASLETDLSKASAQNTRLLLFYMHIIVQMLAFSLAHLLYHVTKNQITPQQLIQRAVIDARKEEALLSEQIQIVRDMAVPEKQ